MSLISKIKEVNLSNIDTALIGCTSKPHGLNIVSSYPIINGKRAISIIVSDKKEAQECLQWLDQHVSDIFVDLECKQPLHLWQIAQKVINKARIIPYKPNDLTQKAAYFNLMQHFDNKLHGKKILVYGVGNVGFKLVNVLAEAGAHVFISGRNTEKLKTIANAINLCLPQYSEYKVDVYSMQHNITQENLYLFDALVTTSSSEHCIGQNYLNFLNSHAIVLDIGINNLEPAFIDSAIKQDLLLLRLDVRIASDLLCAELSIFNSNFYKENAGAAIISSIPCVAGGVIGKNGDIIIDSISAPQYVIGVANGTGGIKNPLDYTVADHKNIGLLREFLQS